MENPIIEKLRKLIAHEKSARSIGNLQEAEAFAAKIQQLLDDHKLSMSEVEFEAREESEPIAWQIFDPTAEGFNCAREHKIIWQIRLAQAISECNTCEVVVSNGSRLYFVGRTSDREICRTFFSYLLDLAYHLSGLTMQHDREREAAKCIVYGGEFRSWMRDYRRSWFLGFAQAICARLYDSHKTRMAEAASTSAMVHISKDRALIKKSVDERSQPVKTWSRSGHNKDAYEKGRATGAAVNLSPNRLNKSSNRFLLNA